MTYRTYLEGTKGSSKAPKRKKIIATENTLYYTPPVTTQAVEGYNERTARITGIHNAENVLGRDREPPSVTPVISPMHTRSGTRYGREDTGEGLALALPDLEDRSSSYFRDSIEGIFNLGTRIGEIFSPENLIGYNFDGKYVGHVSSNQQVPQTKEDLIKARGLPQPTEPTIKSSRERSLTSKGIEPDLASFKSIETGKKEFVPGEKTYFGAKFRGPDNEKKKIKNL